MTRLGQMCCRRVAEMFLPCCRRWVRRQTVSCNRTAYLQLYVLQLTKAHLIVHSVATLVYSAINKFNSAAPLKFW